MRLMFNDPRIYTGKKMECRKIGTTFEAIFEREFANCFCNDRKAKELESLSFDEKRELNQRIRDLPSKRAKNVVKIIWENESGFSSMNITDFTVDLEKLRNPTLHKLKSYVDSLSTNASSDGKTQLQITFAIGTPTSDSTSSSDSDSDDMTYEDSVSNLTDEDALQAIKIIQNCEHRFADCDTVKASIDMDDCKISTLRKLQQYMETLDMNDEPAVNGNIHDKRNKSATDETRAMTARVLQELTERFKELSHENRLRVILFIMKFLRIPLNSETALIKAFLASVKYSKLMKLKRFVKSLRLTDGLASNEIQPTPEESETMLAEGHDMADVNSENEPITEDENDQYEFEVTNLNCDTLKKASPVGLGEKTEKPSKETNEISINTDLLNERTLRTLERLIRYLRKKKKPDCRMRISNKGRSADF